MEQKPFKSSPNNQGNDGLIMYIKHGINHEVINIENPLDGKGETAMEVQTISV